MGCKPSYTVGAWYKYHVGYLKYIGHGVSSSDQYVFERVPKIYQDNVPDTITLDDTSGVGERVTTIKESWCQIEYRSGADCAVKIDDVWYRAKITHVTHKTFTLMITSKVYLTLPYGFPDVGPYQSIYHYYPEDEGLRYDPVRGIYRTSFHIRE